jgi:hypothetical protein
MGTWPSTPMLCLRLEGRENPAGTGPYRAVRAATVKEGTLSTRRLREHPARRGQLAVDRIAMRTRERTRAIGLAERVQGTNVVVFVRFVSRIT